MTTNGKINRASDSTLATFLNWAKALEQALDYDRVDHLTQKVWELEATVGHLEMEAAKTSEKNDE